jgi:hypothetical protein
MALRLTLSFFATTVLPAAASHDRLHSSTEPQLDLGTWKEVTEERKERSEGRK